MILAVFLSRKERTMSYIGNILFEQACLCTAIFIDNSSFKMNDNLSGFRIGHHQDRQSNVNTLKSRIFKDNTARESNIPNIHMKRRDQKKIIK